jgi:hypothetical protein
LVEKRLKLGTEPFLLRRRHRQHPIQVPDERGRSTRIRGRELSGIDPPVQLANEIE